jgi:hypothetical protein
MTPLLFVEQVVVVESVVFLHVRNDAIKVKLPPDFHRSVTVSGIPFGHQPRHELGAHQALLESEDGPPRAVLDQARIWALDVGPDV